MPQEKIPSKAWMEGEMHKQLPLPKNKFNLNEKFLQRVIASPYRVSIWGDKKVLRMDIEVVVQHHEYN